LGVLLAFGLSSVAMGVMLGAFVKTESQANGLSIMLGMTFGLLSGALWPLELFPPTMQTVAHVLPMTWAMQALTDLAMRGKAFSAVLPNIAVMLAFALVFFLVGVRRFRYE
jgi:ABC-2 type transport system permease protein